MNNGTLVLLGAVTGNVTVATGATLQGYGRVGGSLTNNGTLSVGVSTNTAATLAVGGNLTLGSGSTLVVDLVGSNNDAVTVAGTVTINGGTLIVNGPKQVAGTTLPVINAPNGITGSFTTPPDGYTVKIVNGNQLQIIRKVQGFIFITR